MKKAPLYIVAYFCGKMKLTISDRSLRFFFFSCASAGWVLATASFQKNIQPPGQSCVWLDAGSKLFEVKFVLKGRKLTYLLQKMADRGGEGKVGLGGSDNEGLVHKVGGYSPSPRVWLRESVIAYLMAEGK